MAVEAFALLLLHLADEGSDHAHLLVAVFLEVETELFG